LRPFGLEERLEQKTRAQIIAKKLDEIEIGYRRILQRHLSVIVQDFTGWSIVDQNCRVEPFT
jgi:hypothetical protein